MPKSRGNKRKKYELIVRECCIHGGPTTRITRHMGYASRPKGLKQQLNKFRKMLPSCDLVMAMRVADGYCFGVYRGMIAAC